MRPVNPAAGPQLQATRQAVPRGEEVFDLVAGRHRLIHALESKAEGSDSDLQRDPNSSQEEEF